MLFYYKFLFILLQRELKYSHELRILERILRRFGLRMRFYLFFSTSPGQIVSFDFFVRKFLVLY